MVSPWELHAFLAKYLGIDNFRTVDIVINGLEIEGQRDITKAIFAVSLTKHVVDRALQEGADAIMLHHGILLRGSRGAELCSQMISGSLRDILKKILSNDISVFAYHLPLDAHPEIGNNVTIAQLLNLKNIMWIPEEKSPPIGIIGELENPVPVTDFLQTVQNKINKEAKLLDYGPKIVKKIAVVSGAGGGYIYRFRKNEIDLLLTGEIKENHEVYAMNEEINIIVAGHYHTEVFGVRNLAKLVKDRYGIETIFVESPQRI